jgi:hypothetical protein
MLAPRRRKKPDTAEEEGVMWSALLIGSLMIMANMAIQVFAVVWLVRYFTRKLGGFGRDMLVICQVLAMLFAGHLLQFASWGLLFLWLGEFSDFATAFYHSTVNFAALGYGDIVMSEKWRLLGALEAANGVLMFGLTAGTILAAMNKLFSRHDFGVQGGDSSDA